MPQPRICLCVLMNHPYPANLPLLRRIYAGRFSEVLFLMPLQQVPDEDVITVYRGSYNHAAYLTDALHRLERIECDYFLVVHDDVLLNPQLDEASFDDLFPLGPDDGFIGQVFASPSKIGDWSFYYSFLPKLLHPKSLLFGSGIEHETLLRFLPSAEAIRAGLGRSGATSTERVQLRINAPDDPRASPNAAGSQPSAVLLDGLAAKQDHDLPIQQTIDQSAMRALTSLTDALLVAGGRDRETRQREIDLPFPLAVSAYYADCYILPRTRLASFAHFMGVAGAASLFVEIAVPVILHAVCERVWTAPTLGLDMSGFARARLLGDFRDPRVLAFHPIKLSQFRDPARQDGLMAVLNALRAGAPVTLAMAKAAGVEPGQAGSADFTGWHPLEAWGRWASETPARIVLDHVDSGDTIRLWLVAPIGPGQPAFTGSVRAAGGEPVRFSIPTESVAHVEVRGNWPSGALELEFASDQTVCPRELDAASPDDRVMGVGLLSMQLA